MGLETEYGIAQLGAEGHQRANPIQLSSLVVAAYKATQGDHLAPWDYQSEDPLADARGWRLDRAAAHPSQLTNDEAPKLAARRRDGAGAALLSNGGRLYVDHAHPEYATPEVTSAKQAALWDQAGEVVMHLAATALAAGGGPEVGLYKNNTDGKGASYGTHENYLVERRVPFDQVVAALTPYLVTRQVLTGSGRVGLGQTSQEAGFQLSQRADFVEAEVALETTINRPIINTRDEPHADPARWRRLHIIVGDATMAAQATYLRMGLMNLVLGALEAGGLDGGFIKAVALRHPVEAFQQVSRDLTLRQELELAHGGRATALQIQGHYLEQINSLAPAASLQSEATDLISRWSRLLEQLAKGQLTQASKQVEWLAKYQLLERLRTRSAPHLPWDHAKLAAAELRWTDVDPTRCLARLLQAKAGIGSMFDQATVVEAVTHPPTTTRAYVKGQALRRLADAVRAAGWDSLALAGERGLTSLKLTDPWRGNQADLAALPGGRWTVEALVKVLQTGDPG
ncbi:MAG: proteasome accessory factor PafA2 [Micrococcales bacterium]|nr:proteasome accessory factor PafA2 [Micrococcales bacterium]